MKEDNSESGSTIEDIYEDPPKRDCRFPSRNSLLNIVCVELDPPLRILLLRCTFSSVKGNKRAIKISNENNMKLKDCKQELMVDCSKNQDVFIKFL